MVAATTGEIRTESWSHKTARTSKAAKVFRAHAAPHGVCENLINALKLLANQQKDGDSPVNMVVQGFQEKNRLKIMNGQKIHHGRHL